MYHGKGYTHDSVGGMTIPTLIWNVGKLHEQLKGEKEAIEEQHRKVKKRR